MEIVDTTTLDIIGEADFRKKFSNVSFPRVLNDDILRRFGHAVLVPTPVPEPSAPEKVVVRAEKAKYNNNNTYETAWLEKDAESTGTTTPSTETVEEAQARALDALELAYQTALDSYDYEYRWKQPYSSLPAPSATPMAAAASATTLDASKAAKSTETPTPFKYTTPFRWGLRDSDLALFGVNFFVAGYSQLAASMFGGQIMPFTVSAYNRWGEESYISYTTDGMTDYQGILNARKAMDAERAAIAKAISKATTADDVNAIPIVISDPQPNGI
jgi:hypothetical protein